MATEEQIAAEIAANFARMEREASRKPSAEQCDIDAGAEVRECTFEELFEAMQPDKYWYKFFVRPCCPAPGKSTATAHCERLKGDLEARKDFTDEQRAQIAAIIDQRLEWYTNLGICKG